MADVKELDNKISVTWGLIAYMVIGLVGATFVVTTIYNQFILQDEHIRTLQEEIEYIDARHDRKYSRAIEQIEELEDRIKELELPNSDE